VLSAIPINHLGKVEQGEVGTAIFSGAADVRSSDPLEGILVGQIMVAHEAALSLYHRAWSQPPEYFEAQCRYLQMADKAQRTLAILTERLDRHRGAGQQSITVKHITVNADNAVVGDINPPTGGGSQAKIRNQPHAIAHALQPTLRSENKEREAVPVAGDAERPMPDARRPITGSSKGE
jgi:hypothetical protein